MMHISVKNLSHLLLTVYCQIKTLGRHPKALSATVTKKKRIEKENNACCWVLTVFVAVSISIKDFDH